MKITVKEITNNESLIGHIVLHCLTKEIHYNLRNKISDKGHADLILTIDGEEADLESFVKQWESQVGRMIEEKAKEIVDEKFRSMTDLFYDLEIRFKEEIENSDIKLGQAFEEWIKDKPTKTGWYWHKRSKNYTSYLWSAWFFDADSEGEFWQDGTICDAPQSGWWQQIPILLK